MLFPRSSGILLHPVSLPGRFGTGDFGPEAYRFVDFLVAAAQHYWQVLPLGPTGFADSPYMCFSAMAGNHMLISVEVLRDKGLLESEELEWFAPYPLHIDYGRVLKERLLLLKKASGRFFRHASAGERLAFDRFCEDASAWLDDYSLFMALKETHGYAPWVDWGADLVQRRPRALKRAQSELAESIRFHKFLQLEFLQQLTALKGYANDRGIRIIGDLPIYLAHDSAEVWAHPEYFRLNRETGFPLQVAGVPPDYFSDTGQLWGNPLYEWDYLQTEGFEWWVQRTLTALTHVDVIRIDHFRGFESYWAVEYGEETAINGRWIEAPGEPLFETLHQRLGKLPIIAEDLGIITPEVEALRDRFGLPGMKILQFAFGGGADNPYLPHNYSRNCVVYTGTHDNNTSLGWFSSLEPEVRDHLRRYFGCNGAEGVHWDLIRKAFGSVADLAIVPLQDVLGLGEEARLNYPSKGSDNWTWRYEPGMLTYEVRSRLGEVTAIYGRARR